VHCVLLVACLEVPPEHRTVQPSKKLPSQRFAAFKHSLLLIQQRQTYIDGTYPSQVGGVFSTDKSFVFCSHRSAADIVIVPVDNVLLQKVRVLVQSPLVVQRQDHSVRLQVASVHDKRRVPAYIVRVLPQMRLVAAG